MTHECTFYNDTTLPVIVESWINKNELTTMSGVIVEPGKTNQISSNTGEWYLHNLLDDMSHFKLWKDAGYCSIGCIGKFRDELAYDNKYSWMEYEEFNVKLINGIYVFSN